LGANGGTIWKTFLVESGKPRDIDGLLFRCPIHKSLLLLRKFFTLSFHHGFQVCFLPGLFPIRAIREIRGSKLPRAVVD
jgi:hypothetical protein